MNGERRNQIGGIEPVSAPIPHRINQVIVKEFAFETLAKLNLVATKNIGVFAAGLRLQTKEVMEERKRRRNSKESFIEMYKNKRLRTALGAR